MCPTKTGWANIYRDSTASQLKSGQLQAAVAAHEPDIILGTESKIDSSIFSAEVFPLDFSVARKDRKLGGGGVFVAVHNSLTATERPDLDTECEVCWMEIQLERSEPLLVGSAQ